jgi:hypothetical protein
VSDEFVNGYKRLSPFLRLAQNGKVVQLWCPGCDEEHQLLINNPEHGWDWNGDAVLPTFRPSLKTGGMRTTKDVEGRWNGEWVRDEEGKGIDEICHSYITDGVMDFLGDSTHALAGQQARILEWYTHETDGLPGRPPLASHVRQ